MKAPSALSLLLFAAPVAAAPDCKGPAAFDCLQEYADAQIRRLELSPDAAQATSIASIGALRVYLDDGIDAAVNAFEDRNLPLYDLLFTLMIARQEEDAGTAARIATVSLGVSNAAGKVLHGDDAVAQVRKDVHYWHGESKDGLYVILCRGDEDAFQAIVGNVDRDGACEAPYDLAAVHRVFGALRLKPDIADAEAFRAVMEFAYRKQACSIASAVLEGAWTWQLIAEDAESAPWQVIDVTTLCAAELIAGVRL